MANTLMGNRDTDGVTVTNGIRLLSSISGVIALVVVLWTVPDWVSATDHKLDLCAAKIEKLEQSSGAIQALQVEVEVTKTKVEGLADDIKDVDSKLTDMGEKQDKLIHMLLKRQSED